MPKTKQKPKLKASQDNMPLIHCGNRVMKWDDYWAMLREMERRQKPFKKWIEKECIPAYKKHFQIKLTKRTIETHIRVAEIFFDRVLHVGFLTFESIRPIFASKEFPRWWRTHVLDSSETSAQVAASVKKLLAFVKNEYGLEALGNWPKE